MYITARERKILEVILLHEGDITVSHIANELDVSPRTVHRDLKGVEDILKSYNLSLSKQSGVGIQVKGEKEAQEKLKLFLFSASHHEYSPEERQTIVLSALLESLEPVKLVVLANELGVTIATISNDLNKVEERITPFGLELIRKRGYGVQLAGPETAKRKIMSSLILDHLDEFEFISFIRENIQKRTTFDLETVTDRLLGLVDKKKLIIIEKIVEDVKRDLPYPIADSAYIGLVVHLALATERIQQGIEIHLDDKFPEQLIGTREYKIAEKIVVGLENAFQIEISSGEISYITMHLLGAKLRNEQAEFFEESAVQIGLTVQKLIRYVSAQLEVNLENNLDLYQGLVAHLRPALYRMRQNMTISNPLLKRIKEDYADLFHVLTGAVGKCLPDFRVPDEEIGYLVMHFASALIRGEEQQVYSALVVCSSGIGSSKLLSTKMEKELPWLKSHNISLFDFDKVVPEEYSVIISTVPLKDFDGEYILVSPVLSRLEIERIKQAIHRQEPVRKKTTKEQVKQQPDFLVQLKRAYGYTGTILAILNEFKLFNQQEETELEGALRYMCNQLASKGLLANAAEVYEHLVKREQLGGLGIPGTTLSLYHTKSKAVSQPVFVIYQSVTSYLVRAMDGSEMNTNRILLMLSPDTEAAEVLEVLSHISASIIRDEESIALFEKADSKAIYDYLSNQLQEFYRQK